MGRENAQMDGEGMAQHHPESVGSFSAAEIEDARKNPRAGDVWFHGYPRFEYTVTVERGVFREFDGHESMVVKSEDNPLAGGMVSVDVFRQWSLHATLVRRGA